jgi:hypothetical protein
MLRNIFIAFFAMLFSVACIGKNKHPKKERIHDDDANPKQSVPQVNPKAFNAFNIWRDGQGAEILDLPQDYDAATGTLVTDDVFYIERAKYWYLNPREVEFIGIPTEGAAVVNDVLEYSVKNGKQLRLKFASLSSDRMQHAEAIAYCKKQNLRLPTAQELFDFCATGVTEPDYGPNFKSVTYPEKARCGKLELWSVSIWSASRSDAVIFNGDLSGLLWSASRRASWSKNYVRCVGSP